MKFNINNKKKQTLIGYLKTKNLRLTEQRKKIVAYFFSKEKHYSVQELYDELKKTMPQVGHATIYRTMQLLVDVGLAAERRFKENVTRYEPIHRKHHHDHMICLNCGKIIEFEYKRIEKLQQEAAKRHNFHPVSHKMELYGHCSECQEKIAKSKSKILDLVKMKSGSVGKVLKIDGGQHMKKKMETLGIRVGKRVEKVSGHAMRGPVVIKLGATQAAIGHGMAHRIIVELEDA